LYYQERQFSGLPTLKNEFNKPIAVKNTKAPIIAGVLNIIAGVFGIMTSFGGCMNVINAGRTQDAWIIALVIPGSLALVGGLYARRKSNWLLALTGSICAIPAVLGLISTVLIVSPRKEFRK
jgi:hypothetical protein